MNREGAEQEERCSKKKKGKRTEGDEEVVKRDSCTDAPGSSKGNVVMDVEKAKEGNTRKKKKKEKGREKDKKSKGSDDNIKVASAETEHAEGDMSRCSVDEDKSIKKDNKSKKKKKIERKAEMSGKEQVRVGSTDENAGLEHADVDMGDKEQGTKSKKRKRKHADDEPAEHVFAHEEIVTNIDKKTRKEHSVEFEGDQVNASKMVVKTKGNKKRINESDKFNPDISIDKLTRGDDKNGKKRKKNGTLTKGDEVGQDGKNDKKKRKSKEGDEVGIDGENDKKKKKSKEGNGGRKSEKERATWSKDKVRRVSFADSVEVFTMNGDEDKENDNSAESEVVHGVRFTPEENATLLEAINNYIEMKQLGENGLDMIRASGKHPELKGCWAEIAKSLPHRPIQAIYKRARILLFRSDERKWTPEEYEKIRRHVEQNGTSWISLAQQLGKSEIHLKDTWRRIKPKNLKAGPWTQDEYQNLFDLVNLDLRVKAHQKYNAGNRKLRDNIAWEAISDKLTTRNHKNCCLKWYHQLASPLVQKGVWADTDDYRLVETLQNVDAVCIEDVDWDNLLDHRSGEVCRKRWNEMVRNIGGHREKPFIEQVEVLSKRYCPEMLDYREGEA
uniref:Myb-like domain-containing protein n=1 Tax=Leersia perrieri TaxID=77586 RepID=A0A0D9WPL9_9ORYZ